MKQLLILLLFFLAVSSQELITFEENGHKDSSINVVIVAEGYTAGEKSKFETHIGSFVRAIFSDPVLANYRSYHNIYGVFVASNESGADDPNGGVYRDTYFDATYNTGGIDRLLTANGIRANQVVNNLLPEQDMIMISVNYNKYGGSGGPISVSAFSAPEIAAHEIGHSFVGLKDEYDYTANYTPYEGINATAKTSWGDIRWNSWIERSTPLPTPETQNYADVVGIFEGANYKASGWYRPELNCRMKSNGVDLCAVCSEAWILRLYELIPPLKRTTHPSGTAVDLTRETLTVLPREPVNRSVIVEWFIEGELVHTGPTLPAEAAGVELLVSAVLRDTTDYVRNDPSELLKETLTFTVTGTGDAALYDLTVVNGTGSGSYAENAQVSIIAKDSSGFAFTGWVGDTEFLNSAETKTAVVTMPARAVELTAKYSEVPLYSLTVENGSGSGHYGEGEVVTIVAKDSAGYLFTGWIGDTDLLISSTSKTTSLQMPAKDVSVTASYRLFDLIPLAQSEITSASASSEYAEGWSAVKAVDGDVATYWHNATDGTDDLPVEIIFELNNSYKLTGFEIQPRQDTEGSRMKSYKCEVSSDGISWEAVTAGNLENSANSQIIPFPETTVPVNLVRITAGSSHDGDQKASIAEFNLYYLPEVGVITGNAASVKGLVYREGTLSLQGYRESALNISLYSLNGRELFSQRVNLQNGSAAVKLPSLNRGVVLLKITGERTTVRKLIF